MQNVIQAVEAHMVIERLELRLWGDACAVVERQLVEVHARADALAARLEVA